MKPRYQSFQALIKRHLYDSNFLWIDAIMLMLVENSSKAEDFAIFTFRLN